MAYSSWESGQARPADMVERAELLEGSTGIERAWWLGWADDKGPGREDDQGQGLPHLDSNQEPAGYRDDLAEGYPTAA